MVSYYFDNKAGLIAAVLDSVIHDEYRASLERMREVASDRRVQSLGAGGDETHGRRR